MASLFNSFKSTVPARPDRLTTSELNDLERCTAIVDEFVKVHYRRAGEALGEIRDKRLYRMTHDTFMAFCSDRWKMTESYANRLIAAAEVAENLTPTGSVPQTERLARPLASLSAADQVDAWQEAKSLAADDPIRPEHVERAVAKRRTTKKKKAKIKPTRLRVPGGIVVIEPGKGFASVEACLMSALEKLRGSSAAA